MPANPSELSEQNPGNMVQIVKRSLRIAGHATSISLEEPFWRLLRHVAAHEGLGIAALVETIDRERQGANLSSAVRVHLLEWMMATGQIVIPEEVGATEGRE